MLIPIILAALIHMWNPAAFPTLHPDEGDYIRKAVRLLSGYGLQDSASDQTAINQTYAHPHFGQLFLAAILGAIGYPQISDGEPTLHTIEFLYAVPRMLMGVLAVLDTFIVYKIAERRFDKKVGLVASCFFAVMPATLILRHVFLDNILLPFVLLSILIVLYVKQPISGTTAIASKRPYKSWSINNRILITLSGIFLGVSIYTKIPAFTMIPLVSYFVYINSGKRIKMLALWLIPVLVLPSLWPVYALSVGEFDLWLEGVTAQGNRLTQPGEIKLLSSIANIFKIDPVLLVLGIGGVAFAAIKKEYWILLWVVPALIFFYFLGWVIYFHLVLVFPAFCIAGALLLLYGVNLLRSASCSWKSLISTVLISAIVTFGIMSSLLLITYSLNSYQFEAEGIIADQLLKNQSKTDGKGTADGGVVFVGHRIYNWIPRYVFHAKFQTWPADSLPPKWNKSSILLVDNGRSCCCYCSYFDILYHSTKEIESFNRPSLPGIYPFSGILFNPSIGKKVDIRILSHGSEH